MQKTQTPRGSLIYQLNYILNKQYEKGHAKSRHQLKKESGHAQMDTISSQKSWEKYRSSINVFARWAKENDIKHYDAITPDDVEQFLYEQEGRDLVHKTLTGYATALNHVLEGNGREDHSKYSCYKLGIQGSDERRYNRLDYERPIIPEKYSEQFDLIKSTGLRRDELTRVGTRSFYEVNNRYYVSTIGKGGRPRFAEVNQEYNQQFKKRYSDYINKVDSKNDIPHTKTEIKDIYKTQKELFSEKIPSKYATHIYRAEYAQNRFKELLKSREYTPEGTKLSVNGFEADRGLFREISRNLGHNRTDKALLGAYFRSE